MKQKKILLQHKILAGYIILSVVITGMVSVLFYERNRVAEIESETLSIRQVRNDANSILYHISILASYGETVLSWSENDFLKYRKVRLYIDSLLQKMPDCHLSNQIPIFFHIQSYLNQQMLHNCP